MNDLKQDLLSKFDFFNNLPIKKSEVIIDKLELKEYTAGKVIFEKGSEKNAGIFFLIDGVVNFYENEMLNKGWKLVNAIKHETTVLNYQKEGWVCTVMMSSKIGQVFIEIQAGPK